MRVRLQGVALVFGDDERAIGDPAVLGSLHGYSYDDERFTDYLGGPQAEDALAQILLLGGCIRFEHDGHSPFLLAITEYQAIRPLDAAELALLVEYTRGQWSDGIGENLASESGLATGRSIQCQTDAPLDVQQFE